MFQEIEPSLYVMKVDDFCVQNERKKNDEKNCFIIVICMLTDGYNLKIVKNIC